MLRREVIPVILIVLIAIAATLLAFLAFVAVVLGIHVTERRYALRQRGCGRIDTFTRRLLGVYTDPPSYETKSVEHGYTRR
jgi:hypothetical protein